MRLSFFSKRSGLPPGRRIYRAPRQVRTQAENPYFNKRLQRKAVRLAPLVGMAAVPVLAAIAWIALLTLPQFRISGLSVEGHARLTRQDVDTIMAEELDGRAFGIFSRRNYFLVRPQRIREALLKHPDIASADVSTSFPDQMHVRIREREAYFIVLTNGARVRADETGVAFGIFPGEGGGWPVMASGTAGVQVLATGTPSIVSTSTHLLSYLLSQIRARATSSVVTLYDTSITTPVVGEEIVPIKVRTLIEQLLLATEDLRLGFSALGGIYDRSRLHEFTAVTSEGWIILMDPLYSQEAPLAALGSVLREKVKDRSRLQYVDLRYQDRVYFK
ncbi:FtsQ-type POTRA domain-containing protein [Patescibacteria group bacterium]|nr:MAG: FtsQ-type POTRA domain-containing protein [Patescibacteria group bacterium]